MTFWARVKWVKRLQFTKRRDINIEITTVVSLVMLRKFLGEEYGA